MTKQEINQKISILRNDYLQIDMSGGSNGNFEDIPIPKDWHADANWPALLRELPAPELFRYVYTTLGWMCDGFRAATVEEAVCGAWLKWKTK